jgi:anaerobic magnesium-protoporphyrin IX monomethyl ester cyclase
MLFRGRYSTEFYRRVRDALHEEVESGVADDFRWAELTREADAERRPGSLAATA